MISQSEIERLQKIEKIARKLCKTVYAFDEMLYPEDRMGTVVGVHIVYRDLAEALGMKPFEPQIGEHPQEQEVK